MKVCTTCCERKSLDGFPRDKQNSDGYSHRCKSCASEYLKNFRRSKRGLLMQIYNHQKSKSKKRGHNPPTYTRDEFINKFINDNKFLVYYNQWVDGDYNKNLTPSIDRLDDFKGYSFDNIQMITWGIHNRMSNQKRMTGKDNRVNKAIRQLSKEGVFIKEFFSIKEADRRTGVNNSSISEVAKGKRKTAGGFRWEYAT